MEAFKRKKKSKGIDKKKPDSQVDVEKELNSALLGDSVSPRGNVEPFKVAGDLQIVVHSGSGLLSADRNGKSDPYVIFSLLDAKGKEREKVKTQVQKHTLDPVWNETLVLPVSQANVDNGLFQRLKIEVRDDDLVGSDFLGLATRSLADEIAPLCLQSGAEAAPVTVPLFNKKEEQDKKQRGSLSLSFRWSPANAPADDAPPPSTKSKDSVAAAAAASSSTAATSGGKKSKKTIKSAKLKLKAGGLASVVAATGTTTASEKYFRKIIPGTLTVKVLKAKGLDADADTFALVSLITVQDEETNELKTDTIKDAEEPEWDNAVFNFHVDSRFPFVQVELRDQDMFKTRFIGQTRLNVGKLCEQCLTPQTAWHNLGARPDKPNKKGVGQVQLEILFDPAPDHESGGSAAAPAGAADGAAADGPSPAHDSASQQDSATTEAGPETVDPFAELGRPIEGTLQITVHKAKGLIGTDKGGRYSDPFVDCCSMSAYGARIEELGGGKSSACKKTLSPEWTDASWKLHVHAQKASSIVLTVRDKDFSSSQFLGQVVLTPQQLLAKRQETEQWFALAERETKKKNVAGEINISYLFEPIDLDVDEIIRQQHDPTRVLDGSLIVTVKAARDLIAADKDGTSDPFVIGELLNAKGKLIADRETQPIHNNNVNPEWNKKLFFMVDGRATKIRFEIRDKDVLHDESLGLVEIPLIPTFNETPQLEQWFTLQAKSAKNETSGELLLRFNYVPHKPLPMNVEAKKAAAEAKKKALEPSLRELREREQVRWASLSHKDRFIESLRQRPGLVWFLHDVYLARSLDSALLALSAAFFVFCFFASWLPLSFVGWLIFAPAVVQIIRIYVPYIRIERTILDLDDEHLTLEEVAQEKEMREVRLNQLVDLLWTVVGSWQAGVRHAGDILLLGAPDMPTVYRFGTIAVLFAVFWWTSLPGWLLAWLLLTICFIVNPIQNAKPVFLAVNNKK